MSGENAIQSITAFALGCVLGIVATGAFTDLVISDDLIEFQQQAVELNYAEWSDMGYGKTEFRFIEPDKPAPEPKPVKPIGAVGGAE